MSTKSLSTIYNGYLSRYKIFDPNLQIECPFDPAIVVVMPCFLEGDITPALQSLYQSYRFSKTPTIVLIVVNDPESADSSTLTSNQESVQSILSFQNDIAGDELFSLQYVHISNIPQKWAGVGFARKSGFDAVISTLNNTNKDTILAWYDADSLCDKNYLHSIVTFFDKQPDTDAVSIHFEHVIPKDEALKNSIITYELHLRLYIHLKKWLGLPFAFQTIGSSMAVKASSYALFGGMNTKKAGEDFYFLHKIGDNGIVRELTGTTIFPSPRISDRVPFGTGKAMGDHLLFEKAITTYNPQSFVFIKPLFDKISEWYTGKNPLSDEALDDRVKSFCKENDIESALQKMNQNTASLTSFRKKFFQWFNAFRFMKYLHFMRSYKDCEDTDVRVAFDFVLDKMYSGENQVKTPEEMLIFLRMKDKMNANDHV